MSLLDLSYYCLIFADDIQTTVEHYFQAQKFQDQGIQETIRQAKNPFIAAQLGRDRNNILREDWEKVKDQIMYFAIKTKFQQHPDILSILKDTGDSLIIEHTTNDSYWADGGDGSGLNILGKMLMRVREELID